jgi:dipeptidyl aminopeptidase/acylaminoacyl peptidase
VPEVSFPGAIVYAKAGNIWVQQGGDARQLTSGGKDSMPTWAPDGQSVYFVRTTEEQGLWPAQGTDRHYRMDGRPHAGERDRPAKPGAADEGGCTRSSFFD